MEFIEKYQDVLQNIEFSIVSVYRDNLEITDYTVMRSLESIIDHYAADKIWKATKKFLSWRSGSRDFSACPICL